MFKTISFRDLSITKKIHAITSISVVVFVISATINYSAMSENKHSLDELKTTSYKVVQLATSNKYLLEKLNELYTQSVTFGDEEIFVSKDSPVGLEINQRLNDIKTGKIEDKFGWITKVEKELA